MTPEQWLGLDSTHLIEVEQGHKLERETAEAFIRMQKAAEADGIGLNIASSHRDFHRQCSIWNRKWLGELPLFNRNGEQLSPSALTENEKLHAILTWSALPGASRHHWGTDLDVYDKASCESQQHALALVPEEYQAGGPCHALSQWLDSNMADFGFYRPYASDTGGVAPEPWHLSYRPVAEAIVEQMTIDTLENCIQSHNVEGKPAILSALPSLFNRYTLNRGYRDKEPVVADTERRTK